MRTRIPRDHPRYHSLVTRERMKEALERGLIHPTGLIAHGRGEAFDYLLGERTPGVARRASRAGAAALLLARQPVLSCNGNVVALAAKECVLASKTLGARLEVNLFHRSEDRVERLVRELERAGGRNVLGPDPDARIPNLSSDRAKCHRDGIFGADVVLVPLEDGDRAQALVAMGKTVVTIDLNPLSRTAVSSTITIVDELRRALRNLTEAGQRLADKPVPTLRRIVQGWRNDEARRQVLQLIGRRLDPSTRRPTTT